MNISQLNVLTYNELKDIATGMDIKISKKKEELIIDMLKCFKEYEKYKKEKVDKYQKIKQLGEKGKEGITFLVKTIDGNEYAMKTFKKTKSSNRLRKEAYLQEKASEFNITPKIIEIDTISKYIVMEKLDEHLIDKMKKQDGNLTENQQKQIIKIFKFLDKAKVFHADSNILNYMFKGKKLYIIDFGMSQLIDEKLIKKLGIDTPNLTLMNLGFILKLKELKCPPSSYSHLITFISDKDKGKYGLE
jgi:tRNA A-37 threonylcarbamoyl transferase component Bud32